MTMGDAARSRDRFAGDPRGDEDDVEEHAPASDEDGDGRGLGMDGGLLSARTVGPTMVSAEGVPDGMSVQLRHLTKTFGSVHAVDDLSLTLRVGEFFSLLGPSGCGKTTTLRLIGGFERPSSGEVLLSGKNVTETPPNRRDVNTVFQSYALFPHLSVWNNVAYGLRRKRIKSEDMKNRVRDALSLVALEGMEYRKPSQLSGGQQQRVALARALVNRPQVLLLDEPMGALDAQLRKNMQVELKRIQHDVGLTFVYVTHDQDEALSMSDRIAVMRSGRIEGLGTSQGLYDHPPTEFVASFLGAANLIGGEIVSYNESVCQVRIEGAPALIRLPSARVRTPKIGRKMRVGVRPEKLALFRDEDLTEPGNNVLPVTVTAVTYLGVGFQYRAVLSSGETIVIHEQDRGQRLIGVGEATEVVWRPDYTFIC